MEEVFKNVIELCRLKRVCSGKRQRDISEKLNYSIENISFFERGKNNNSIILLYYIIMFFDNKDILDLIDMIRDIAEVEDIK